MMQPVTFEDRIKRVLGEQQYQIIALAHELGELRRELDELKAASVATSETSK